MATPRTGWLSLRLFEQSLPNTWYLWITFFAAIALFPRICALHRVWSANSLTLNFSIHFHVILKCKDSLACIKSFVISYCSMLLLRDMTPPVYNACSMFPFTEADIRQFKQHALQMKNEAPEHDFDFHISI